MIMLYIQIKMIIAIVLLSIFMICLMDGFIYDRIKK